METKHYMKIAQILSEYQAKLGEPNYGGDFDNMINQLANSFKEYDEYFKTDWFRMAVYNYWNTYTGKNVELWS